MKYSISFFLVILMILMKFVSLSQIGINSDNSAPDGSAMMDLKSTNSGILIPRMTSAERNSIALPSIGLLVFQIDAPSGFYFFDGNEWTTVAGSGIHYPGELYGGGVVFWVDDTGQHGLICNMVDLSLGDVYSNKTSTLIGETAQSDWNGLANSNAIVGQSGHTYSAAKLCFDYVNNDYGTGIYNDWYLPARNELIYLWNNFKEVQKALDTDGNSNTTAIARYNLWSSTEMNATRAYCLHFGGYLTDTVKNMGCRTRAVRQF